MKSFRLALLASCIALPALAQEIPARDANATTVRATADAQRGVADAQARVNAANAQAQATATANLQGDRAREGGTTAAHADASSVPRTMPPVIDPIAPDRPLTPKERAGLTVARTWIQKFQTPHLDGDGVVHFTAGKGQVFVVTAVDHVTDIALAPGEIIAPPLHVGDADSWKTHVAMSGSGQKTTSHILVKPIDAGLSTNVVVETNKRTLSVALTSRRQDYMPLVSLDIPGEDDDRTWSAAIARYDQPGTAASTPASPCDQQPVITPDQFKITGDDVSWRPVQAYAVSTPVGMKTCIDFPSSIGSEDLPALLALADDGGWFSSPTKKIVNVRYVRRRFIADELLTRFILVDGVGGDQKKIDIERKKS
jgi:P-type conjugative transfer protein TrbG